MTAIHRWTPSPEFKNFQVQLNRLFEPYVRTDDEDLVSGNWLPPVDVAETQDRIVVRAELPGVNQDQIQIEFENGLLTIRGERNFQKQDGTTWHRVERVYGSFSRTFTLPSTVDAEHITAESKDGVLRVHLPKRAESKPRQIKVGVTTQGTQSAPVSKH